MSGDVVTLLIADDVWEGVGLVNGTDYLVTAKSLAASGYTLSQGRAE